MHESSSNCMQPHVTITACKIIELYASSWNCIPALGTAFLLLELHASLWQMADLTFFQFTKSFKISFHLSLLLVAKGAAL